MKTLIALTSSDKERIKSLFDEYTRECGLVSKMVINEIKEGWWIFSKWTYDPDISTEENHFKFFDFNYCGYFENYFAQFIISINNMSMISDTVFLDDEEVRILNELIRGNNND